MELDIGNNNNDNVVVCQLLEWWEKKIVRSHKFIKYHDKMCSASSAAQMGVICYPPNYHYFSPLYGVLIKEKEAMHMIIRYN